MAYVPIGDPDRERMLRAIGLERVEDLFSTIPEKYRLRQPLNLPAPHAEPELRRRLGDLARKNTATTGMSCFLGAGAYRHHIPAVVSHLLSRSEFYSSYTPYQPEISQGTLQAIFEYQTMICQLTGMEVANASLYDGASALAETILLCRRLRKGNRVLLADSIHPHYRQVAETYCQNLDVELVTIPHGESGRIDRKILADRLRKGAAAVIVQSPNFFGVVEDLKELAGSIHGAGALFSVAITDPICLGILVPPGEAGADCVFGEAQAFGGELMFGGPYLGFLATREGFVRQMPGRLVGLTKDNEGNPGYVLTLATREQHIRRAKATSNICTNQGLCALGAAVFLSSLGRRGLREMALQNLHKAHYARKTLAAIDGCSIPFGAEIFNEFVLQLPADAQVVADRLEGRGIIPGLPLGRFFPDLRNSLLVCVTEVTRRQEIDALAGALREVI